MKDYTTRDLEKLKELLWSSTGIPDKYMNSVTLLEMIGRKRKRIRNIKEIYFNGKTRD